MKLFSAQAAAPTAQPKMSGRKWMVEVINHTSFCPSVSVSSNSKSYVFSGGGAASEGQDVEVHTERNGANQEGARRQGAQPAESLQ